MKLSLATKCLILVAIPACFELASFAILLNLQNEAASENKRIERARIISGTVNRICLQVINLEDYFTNEADAQTTAANIDRGMKNMLNDFKQLEVLTADDPPMHDNMIANIARLKQVQRDLYKLKNTLLTDPSIRAFTVARSYSPIFKKHIRSIAYGGLLQLASQSSVDLNRDVTEQTRQTTITLLKIAVSLSLLLAACSAIYLSKSMTSRIKVLAANALRIGQRKPLLEPIGGGDEIAVLDRTLHQTSELISTLERNREEITAMVGHDIRSPLTTIKCAGEALSMKLGNRLDEESQSTLNEIEANCDRILRISQDLLDMQRLESGSLLLDKQRCDLRKCLKAAAAQVQGICQKRAVTVEITADSICSMVDQMRIEQVLVNLLTNAIKNSPTGSTVSMRLAERPAEGLIQIDVIDKGPGIPEPLAQSIFDKFVQVSKSDSKQGSGLGLAIVRALVKLHEGTVSVENLRPVGCKFSVFLPFKPV